MLNKPKLHILPTGFEITFITQDPKMSTAH